MKMMNQRETYGKKLVELGEKYKNIVVCEADLGKSTMSYMFQERFPERYFEMGIAEANMVSFATGLALTNKVAFVNTFAVFASGRAYDQIRQSVAIGKFNVKVIGSSSGLSDFGDGATHQAIEDLAIMRAIPNMTVLAPMDAIELEKMMDVIVEYDGPVYMRVNRNDLPALYPEDKPFEIGQPVVIREGKDITVFAHGVMVSMALKAAEQLEKEGISLRVVNVSSLKPLNQEKIIQYAKDVKGVVTAEEHSIIGGLAEIIPSILKGTNTPIESVAVKDVFGQSAQSYEELLVHYGLTDAEIVAATRKILGV